METSLVFDEQVSQAACLEYLNMTLSSLLAEISGAEGLLPTPHHGGMPIVESPSIAEDPSYVNGGGVMMCLASVLEALSDCDESCVFSVRKINKLGFKSHSALKKYFGQFGVVASIFFLPYRYKPDTSSVRPSSMAFVRMAHRRDVEMIFANGTVHYIHGWPVTVQVFNRSSS